MLSDIFMQFYGLDWLSMFIGFIGMYLLSNGSRIGFLVIFLSLIFAFIVAVIAQQYGFLVANAVNMFFALRGYFKNRLK